MSCGRGPEVQQGRRVLQAPAARARPSGCLCGHVSELEAHGQGAQLPRECSPCAHLWDALNISLSLQ